MGASLWAIVNDFGRLSVTATAADTTGISGLRPTTTCTSLPAKEVSSQGDRLERSLR